MRGRSGAEAAPPTHSNVFQAEPGGAPDTKPNRVTKPPCVHEAPSGAKASGPWSCSSPPSAVGASGREERARAARPAERRASYEAVVDAIVILIFAQAVRPGQAHDNG